jgi:hypothetical protein
MVLNPCISRKIIIFLMSLYTCVLEMLRTLKDLNACSGKRALPEDTKCLFALNNQMLIGSELSTELFS